MLSEVHFVRGAPTTGESLGTICQFAKIDNLFMRIASDSLSRGKGTILDRDEEDDHIEESAVR